MGRRERSTGVEEKERERRETKEREERRERGEMEPIKGRRRGEEEKGGNSWWVRKPREERKRGKSEGEKRYRVDSRRKPVDYPQQKSISTAAGPDQSPQAPLAQAAIESPQG